MPDRKRLILIIGIALGTLSCGSCCFLWMCAGALGTSAPPASSPRAASPPIVTGDRSAPDAGAPTAPPEVLAEPPAVEAPPPEPARVSLWDDPGITRIDSSCPDGLWAVVPGYTPGRDEFERRAAEVERAGLAARFEGQRFRVTRALVLGEYDFARDRYPAAIEALSSCRGSGMAITIALSRARVAEHREREGTVVGIYREWAAEPVATHIEVPEERAAELVRAPEGMLGALRGPPALRAEIIFEIASARVDRRMHRDAIGETDIGAGALIQGRVVAIRITNTRTDEILLDTTAEGVP